MNKLHGISGGAVLALVFSLIASAQTTNLSNQSVRVGSTDAASLLEAIEATEPVPAEFVPQDGTYYSAAMPMQPPLPSSMGYSAWNLGSNMWLVDDLDQLQMSIPMMNRAIVSFESLNSSEASGPVYGSNDLWLEITGIANGQVGLILHGGTNQVYAIWSTANLSAGWNVEMEVWPTNSEVMPFAVPTLERQDLFERAEDWTGVDSDGDGIPDWWIWKYFGDLLENATNLDSQGNTLLSDYQNGFDPNVISFSIVVTNNYVGARSALIQLDVSQGVPFYQAVLVDSTNFDQATWIAYQSSNITVNLGITEGWHELWVGLKGLPGDATKTWQWKRLKFDCTPPVLVVTNPVLTTLSQPMIQVQGFCPEDLAGISYDITNAAGILTNQQAHVLDRFFDTNTWEFTTNTFQGFDILLTNGVNTITLHTSDLAGNVTTTNLNFTLVSDTNPPVVSLSWPQDGMALCGDAFTVHGVMDDPSATITATLVNTNGQTNVFAGLVERNGKFWMEDLPLTGGTNFLTLIAVDTWGNVATTNISVRKSDLSLNIDPVDASQLYLPSINVSGTVGDASYSVSVNGVQAAVNGDGTWIATNVPVNSGGTASFYVSATVPGGADPGKASFTDQPARLYVAHYEENGKETLHFRQDYDSGVWCTEDESGSLIMNWDDGKGGQQTSKQKQVFDCIYLDAPDTFQCETITTWTVPPNPASPYGTFSDSPCGCSDGGYPLPPRIVWQHCEVQPKQDYSFADFSIYPTDFSEGPYIESGHVTGTTHAKAVIKFYSGGKGVPAHQSAWRAGGAASEHRQVGVTGKYNTPVYHSFSIQPQNIVLGDLGQLDSDGVLYTTIPDYTTIDVTPKVSGIDYYTFSVGWPGKYILKSQVSCPALTDTNLERTSLGVGESVSLGALPEETTWKTSAGSLSARIGPSTGLIAPSSAGSATVTATIRKVTLSIGFGVVEPSGYDHADITSTDTFGNGVSGAGMSLNVWLTPTTVSFKNVQVMEVGGPASGMSGYFIDHPPQPHGTAQRANQWYSIGCDNLISGGYFDHANYSVGTGPWNPGGSFTWQIPVIWKVGNGPTHSLTTWNQDFSLQANGTFTVAKFGRSVTRTINNVITTQ